MSRVSILLHALLTACLLCRPALGSPLSTTVRAAECIANSTHCHCAMKAAAESSVCYKPDASEDGKCVTGKCAAGYHCDCNANDICMKVSTVYYRVEGGGTPSTESFACTQDQAEVPRVVVGQTSDFHIIVYQQFQLFVNAEQIGFGEANVYSVFTGEIKSGDVVAVVARRQSADVFGVKLRFTDIQSETRFIDENWYASDQYVSSWLDKSFDPNASGWGHPSIAKTVTDASFDADVPWMWKGTADTVYFRYVSRRQSSYIYAIFMRTSVEVFDEGFHVR